MGKIYVAGHTGLVGSAIVRKLKEQGHNHIVAYTSKELDLRDRLSVEWLFTNNDIEQVYFCAAKVGGIVANNTLPATLMGANLMMQTNVINAAYKYKVKRLLFVGSTCIYPKVSPQPIDEDNLLNGFLEPTNEPYAITKIAGLKLCESYNREFGTDFRAVLPSNIYGPNDNFHPENSHLLAGIMSRMYEAKMHNSPTVTIWGTGTPRREFLYSDDMAEGCIAVMDADKRAFDSVTRPMRCHLNLGPGYDVEIREFAEIVKKVIGYNGELVYDTSRPDGTMLKCTDVSRIKQLGWTSRIGLEEGITRTYKWYLENIERVKKI